MTTGTPKDVIWVSSSLDDLQRFPDPVKKLMGFALSRLRVAQESRRAEADRKEGK